MTSYQPKVETPTTGLGHALAEMLGREANGAPAGVRELTLNAVREELHPKAKITGLSPDAPIAVNQNGGKQSHTAYDFALLDPAALFRLAEVMKYGAEKYGPDNWRLITARESVNHCIGHLYAWLAGDKSDDHLGHAFARAMMALAATLAEPAKGGVVAPAKATQVCQGWRGDFPMQVTLSRDFTEAQHDEDLRERLAAQTAGVISGRLRRDGVRATGLATP